MSLASSNAVVIVVTPRDVVEEGVEVVEIAVEAGDVAKVEEVTEDVAVLVVVNVGGLDGGGVCLQRCSLVVR